MKIKFKKKHIIIAAANILCIGGFAALILTGSSMAASQTYNFAYEQWAGEDSDNYSQFSIFSSDSSGFTTDTLGSVRNSVLSSLQTVSIAPEDGQKLCPDAYSAPVGKSTVRSDINGRSEAEVTAVGGDFFTINGFRLIDGSFFSDEDLMQDGAVIDRSLAWALYGGANVSGMGIEINGISYYISGVVENISTSEEKKCAGELPRAYISYDGASAFASVQSSPDSKEDLGEISKFNKITCYEIIMPDPVEGYALQALKQFSESYGSKMVIVQNDSRFDFWERFASVSKLTNIAVKDNDIIYPYWENASRIVELKLTLLYTGAALLLIFPLLTALRFIFRGIKYLKKNKRDIIKRFLKLFNKKRTSSQEVTNVEQNQLFAENDIRKEI